MTTTRGASRSRLWKGNTLAQRVKVSSYHASFIRMLQPRLSQRIGSLGLASITTLAPIYWNMKMGSGIHRYHYYFIGVDNHSCFVRVQTCKFNEDEPSDHLIKWNEYHKLLTGEYIFRYGTWMAARSLRSPVPGPMIKQSSLLSLRQAPRE
jgi:hypothetical protein